MNLILEDSQYVDYYTYLDQVFSQILEFQNYWWLISDLDLNIYPDTRLQNSPIILQGLTLNEIIQSHKIQFIWGVLSGFKDRIEKLPIDLPYADGNRAFWKGSPKPQAPGAQVEIACLDSSCTLFIGVNNNMASRLKDIYPDIRDLDMENKKKS